MSNTEQSCLLQCLNKGVLTLTLNRPHVKNAMNHQMVEELAAAFAEAGTNETVRAVVIRGADGTFCAGGDIKDMSIAGKTESQVSATNRHFGTLLETLQSFPKLLVTVLEGAALGGGFGLTCVSDIAIAEKTCRFGMPEVTLGLIPAQIAPFVLARIGLTHTRRLALTGQIFSGTEAHEMGLVHYLAEDKEVLERQLEDVLIQALKAGPSAMATTKNLLLSNSSLVEGHILDSAADMFATALMAEEGQEGTAAFKERRRPRWSETAA